MVMCLLIALGATAVVTAAGPAGAKARTNRPGSPTGVTATSGNQQLALSWTAPVNDGGSPITGYVVAGSYGNVAAACQSTATSCMVSSLKNGHVYRVRILADNANGKGPYSATIDALVGLPDPPMVTATSGNGSAVVSWTPTADGIATTRYTVTASPGGATCATTSTSCQITGLTNGTPYTFSVVAADRYGTGPAGVATATPATVPGPPLDVAGTAGNTSVSVGWAPPTDDGGSPVTGYTATASPGGTSCASASTSCTIAGLVNGDPYTVTVTATNAAGTGAPSAAPPAVVPATVPGPPTGLTFAPGYESVSVSWVPPVDDGGSEVTSYEVTEQATGGTCTSTETSCSVIGLSQGVDYSFTVTATNSAGTGPPSSVTPFTSACIPAYYTNVAGCDLRGINLSGDSAIYDNFTGADLSGADLTGTDLSFATLTGADLAGADLTGANLNGITSGAVTGTPAALPAGWAIDNGYLVGPGSTINATDLGGTDLSSSDLNYDSLTNDSFAGSDLAGVLLDYATLTGDDFTGADLEGANLSFATLTGTDLAGADLTGANLNGIVSGGITGTPAALPAGWVLDNGYLVGPGSTINGIYLGDTDLSSSDLNYDSLTNDSFAGSDLAGVLLDYATLTGDDFTGADLAGANLSSAVLTGANFSGADLTGAIFFNTTCSDGTNSNDDNGTCVGH
jgi:uncharacterized protein YjbI with pentapeptide repeats